MSEKRYEANIIRATAVEPANNLETTSAPGVWSIDEVVELQKKNKWPTVGNVATDVTDVFSTFVYEGNGEAKVIENGIALGNAGDGGSLKGGTGTWINVPASSDFGFGTGDFTIECFFFMEAKKNYNTIIDFRTSNESNDLPVIYVDNTPNLVYFSTSARISGSIAAGQYYHIAVSRSGTSTKMFLNGTQLGSTFTDNTNYVTPTATWSLGAAAAQTTYEVNGFVSNVRVVKGTALYTSNFTAPTSALTAVTNTKLLTLQGSTPFVDNSSSSHTLTQNGSPVASDFGPFTGSSGQGGLVWIKKRNESSNSDHLLFDTARGANKRLRSNTTDREYSVTEHLNSFNSTGFTLGNDSPSGPNVSDKEYVAWTFRKKAKFFDVVTYTGNFTAGTTISHNLGQEPGMIIFKDASNTRNWYIYHRSLGKSTFLSLDQTIASFSNTFMLNNTDPTSTEFTLGEATNTNANGATYVAYLFAHNNNDGEFGPDQDQDIIKCGSYTGNGTTDGSNEITLGFEPQWIFLKRSDGSGYYSQIIDSMRGMVTSNNDQILWPNVADAENGTINSVDATATGFSVNDSSNSNLNGSTWIYMAIRRGPLAQPTSATNVFAIETRGASSPGFTSNFPVDMFIRSYTTGSGYRDIGSRLTGAKAMQTSENFAEGNDSSSTFDYMNGYYTSSSADSNQYSWMWKRASSYFDVCTYTGDGTSSNHNRTAAISHNLGVQPEMVWVKRRDTTSEWVVAHKDYGAGYLNLSNSFSTYSSMVTTHNDNFTATNFKIGAWQQEANFNVSGATYIAYLFATVAGVSKVGSYTADGNAQNIDCGFSSGAKFVLIKRSNGTGNWFVLDTARGIVAGNDPLLELNTNSAQDSGYDNIDPYNAGFTITAYGGTSPYLNISGATYIFYAIAT